MKGLDLTHHLCVLLDLLCERFGIADRPKLPSVPSTDWLYDYEDSQNQEDGAIDRQPDYSRMNAIAKIIKDQMSDRQKSAVR